MTSTPTRPGLAATVALYALARLGLVAAVAVVLALVGVPVLVAVLVGLIVALPLSMVLFRGLRERLDAALAVVHQRRSAEREALRSRLRGDAAAEPRPEVKPGTPETAHERVGVADDTLDNTADDAVAGSDPAAPGQPDRGQD